MAESSARLDPHVPSFVPALNGVIRRLLGAGMPMGPNGLLTIRGRTTGVPHTFPVAFLELDGRRYVQGTFGETNWVKNLRAAGDAVISKGGASEEVDAVELTPEQAAVVLRGALAPFVGRRLMRPLVGRFFHLPGGASLDDYRTVAQAHPTFELRPRR
jgi:deazaflavin-dependent oxidoreductase (nitroreductase family)